jgi:hypothetical protein
LANLRNLRWQIIGFVVVAPLLTVYLYLSANALARTFASNDRAMPSKTVTDGSGPIPADSRLLTPVQCRDIATVDNSGQPLAELYLENVRAVHEAACHHDYAALAKQMDSDFYHFQEISAEYVIETWQREDPAGIYLEVLAATLEIQGKLSQGGLTFCGINGATVIFARGTYEHPGKLIEFEETRGRGCGYTS